MVTIFAPVKDITPEEFSVSPRSPTLGRSHGTMAALKHMRARNHGTIVQVGSALSYRAIPAAVGLLRREVCHSRLYRCLRSELEA